jgi:hypothetical protein
MFRLIKIENGRQNVPEPEYLIASAAVGVGVAVALSGGKISKSATAPTHITIGAAAAANDKVPCVRINKEQVYEVATSEAISGVNVGDKVTLDTNADKVTKTTTSGIATIVSLEGASEAGDTVLVRF